MQQISNLYKHLKCNFPQSRRVLSFILIILFFSSCTGLKYISEKDPIYTGAEVKLVPTGRVKARKKLKAALELNISAKPTGSILGIRPSMWLYYAMGTPKKKKGLKNFIKTKLGKPPVFMRDIDVEQTTKLLKSHLINNGFFKGDIKPQVVIKKKTGKVIYTAYVQRPYRIRDISFPKTDSLLFKNIDSIKQDSYLKTKQRYNLERLQAEQSRIEGELENYGFYYFDDRHLIFEADSTVGKRQIDLELKLETGVPAKAKRIYTLGEITIYPDYTLSIDSIVRTADTLKVNGYNYIDKRKNYRPKIITQIINLRPGKIYRREDREFTLSHLMSLGSFKFVDIKFTEAARDSSLLDANIYLTPYLKKSLRADLQAVSKSNNFVGPGLTLNFTNRNFLRGSERFKISVNTAYEVQISRKIPNPLNAFELGVDAGLSMPRFVSPLKVRYTNKKYLPTTEIQSGFRLQQRIGFFRLNSFNLGYGYTWRENTLKTHEFFPIDINFVKLGHTSGAFDSLVNNNQFLKRSFENQFIIGARYSYTINTQINQERANKYREQKFERSHFYFNGKVDVAGNMIHLVQDGFDDSQRDEQQKIFGQPYSQFVKGEIDFRYYYQLSEKKLIATRINAGTGYAFSNSTVMPYIKQFAIGGSNSLRAFPARSIGPGTYNVRTDIGNNNSDSPPNTNSRTFFIDQRGDIKLEGNAEFRFDLTKVVKGAVFVDAGNIWLIREDVNRPGGKFDRDTFLKQLAVGTGAGLRFDFNFFVLRFDLALPLRKPWLPDGQRWVAKDIDLGSSTWRGDNLILNIAIGYPF
jgi:outer membrane protein insertion porin family